jgi:hypothetical protein
MSIERKFFGERGAMIAPLIGEFDMVARIAIGSRVCGQALFLVFSALLEVSC